MTLSIANTFSALQSTLLILLLSTHSLTTYAASSDIKAQEISSMYRIQIALGDQIILAQLENNATSRDFIALLPLDIELSDYASTEKVTDLPGKLSTAGAPNGFDPGPGDITYYAPWGNLAIFYRDFSYSRGLINLGKITQGAEHLSFSGNKHARIEQIK